MGKYRIVIFNNFVSRLAFLPTRYGRSIGSGPSCYIASHPCFKVAGLVLHSPIASGIRILKFDVKFPILTTD